MSRSKAIQLAWAAGFFDGEGTTCIGRNRNGTMHISLSIGQVDRRLLVRFQEAVGYGRIGKPQKPRGLSRKVSHRLRVTSAVEVRGVLDRLWPYLSDQKKEQASRALMTYDTRPLLRGRINADGRYSQCRNGHPYTKDTPIGF